MLRRRLQRSIFVYPPWRSCGVQQVDRKRQSMQEREGPDQPSEEQLRPSEPQDKKDDGDPEKVGQINRIAKSGYDPGVEFAGMTRHPTSEIERPQGPVWSQKQARLQPERGIHGHAREKARGEDAHHVVREPEAHHRPPVAHKATWPVLGPQASPKKE